MRVSILTHESCCWSEGGPEALETFSDAWGRFMFDGLRPGTWIVQVNDASGRAAGRVNVAVFDDALSSVDVEAPDVGPSTIKPTFVGEEDVHTTDQQPSPDDVEDSAITVTGSVRGRVVRRETGEPVAEAALTVVQSAGPTPDIAPLTNYAGEFILDGLPQGAWRFRATDQTGGHGEAAVIVRAGGVAEVLIAVAGAPQSLRK